MPPKVSISKEQVLDAAFELVRRDGLDALSARPLARELGCSTPPVYRAYRSMDELRQGVLERARQTAKSYLVPDGADGADEASEWPFLQVGLGSLRFARDEPELWRALTLSGHVLDDLHQGKPPPEFVLERMRADPALAGQAVIAFEQNRRQP